MSNHSVDIIPTTIPRDRDDLLAAIGLISPFSKKIHIDIDDGLFAPQVSWPYVGAGMYGSVDITKPSGVLLEAHLMVSEPRTLGIDLAHAGVRSIVGHIEACTDFSDAESMLAVWRAAGAHEVGLAILLDTPLRDLDQCIAFCDVVQVMSVAHIGAQGAPFDQRAVERVRLLHQTYPNITIVVDGGVSIANIVELAGVGASRFAVGSAIMQAVDPASAYQQLTAVLGAV